ncbi:hypothetical protein IU498_06445 [Nocardia beijingensis]|uniref:hypothetical protein n=1 Tax=Nocardia beijingensis TaxID=95162 RepID=UPI0018934F35|nr:hypothetical protein [Nocardia beijingensis]MBF6074270.1 hypothetical protein [Nocardia beijingensis]
MIYSNAYEITAAANALASDGHPIDTDDLATIFPYITHTIRRFGDWALDLCPPDALPVTTLDRAGGAVPRRHYRGRPRAAPDAAACQLRRRVLDGHHPLGFVTSSRSWSRSTAALPSEGRLLPRTRHLQVGESYRAENLIFELWEITGDGSSLRSSPFNDG